MKFKIGLFGLGIFLGMMAMLVGWQIYIGSYQFKGSEITPPVPATDFQLTDQNGETFRLSDHQGEVVLLFFGYTHCPDVCPVSLYEFKQVKAALGDRAENVQFVLITLDPERDTVEVMNRYLKNYDPTFIGLTGSEAELGPVWKSYGVYQEKVPVSGQAGYLVDHSAFIYAIDKQGNWRLTYAFGTDTEHLIQDTAHLLLER
jgi:protein SCO1